MPILYKNNTIGYFAHIPKCAGSSVEHYCNKIGIKLAFIDRSFVTSPASQPWNISSPQHIDGYSLSRLFPSDFFEFGFAVVRDPVKRFLSAFKHQLFLKQISANCNASIFVKEELSQISEKIGKYDNHFLPQTNFLIPGMSYEIFKLENGLEHLKHFIDLKLLGNKTNESILHYNSDRSKGIIKPTQLNLDSEAMEIIREVYSDDFSRLKY